MGRIITVTVLAMLISASTGSTAARVRLAAPGNALPDGDGFVPARYESGPLPPLPPPNTVGWIEDRMGVEIDAAGEVSAVAPLRRTPLPKDILTSAIARWHFRPAAVDRRGVPARVLVASVFRPPVTFNNPTPGDPPIDLADSSADLPVPVRTTPPLYPPLAVADAVVLVEVDLGVEGEVRDVRAVAGPPPFDQASVDAARRWTFRPARRQGRPVAAYAYLIFGFRRPLAQ